MADGRELATHAKRPQEAMKREINSTGRERGVRGFSPPGKWRRRRLGDGWPRGGEDGGRRSFSVWRLRPRARRKLERGQQGAREGGSAPICSGRGARGGAPTMHGAWAAVAQTPGAGGCRAARGRGRRRQVGPGRQRLGRRRRGDGCGQAVRLGWAAVLGRARRGGELGWGWCWVVVLGRGEKREGQRAEIQEGRGIKVILRFFLQFSKSLFKFNFQFFSKYLLNS